MAYDRYSLFRTDSNIGIVPFVPIPKISTDVYVKYYRNKTRLDSLSYKYYNDSSYGWLIMQANPELGCYEFLIPNNTRIRVPYPLQTTLTQYASDIETYDKLYGI